MKIFLSSILLLSSIAPGFAQSFNGKYELTKAKGERDFFICEKEIIVEAFGEGKEKGLLLRDGSGYQINTFHNDLDFEGMEDDTGTIGYNREGGRVSERRATDIHTMAGFSLVLFGFPLIASDGYKLKLSKDGNTLTLREHDTLYGFGKRKKCVYKRIQ